MSDEAPIAYLHTLDSTDGIEENEPSRRLTFSPENPFGKPGLNYSEEYPWTVEPLYRGDEITRLRTDLTKAEHIIAAYELVSVQRGADLHAAITRANHAEADLAAVLALAVGMLAHPALVDDDALVEIAAKAQWKQAWQDAGGTEEDAILISGDDWHQFIEPNRAAIAAIRPHIEAAERERCEKDIKPHFPHKSAEQIKKEIDQLIEKHKESVNAWLEAGSWKQSGAGNE